MVQNSAGKIMQKKANTINICYEFSEQHQLGKNVAKFGRKLLQSLVQKVEKFGREKCLDKKLLQKKANAINVCYEFSEQYQLGTITKFEPEPSQTCEAPTSCRDASSIGTTLCAVVLMSIGGFNLFQGGRSIGELLRRSGPRGAPILTSICSSIGTTCCAFRRRWGSSQICEASTSCRDASSVDWDHVVHAVVLTSIWANKFEPVCRLRPRGLL